MIVEYVLVEMLIKIVMVIVLVMQLMMVAAYVPVVTLDMMLIAI